MFGQTGSGKSTFLNAIVNYIAEVEMEDTYRYKIIVEDDSNPMQSITSGHKRLLHQKPKDGTSVSAH